MTYAPCCKAGSRVFKPVSVPVLCANRYDRRTGDYTVFSGHAETALRAGLLAFGRDDDRVYKLKYLLVIFIFNIGFNDEDNTAQYADLRSRKADAVCVFKRFGHVVKKLVES